MRYYWDTSAAINALVSKSVWDRLESGEHFASLHLFAEFFSTMTGRGIPLKDANGNPIRFKMTGKEAAEWLRNFATRVRVAGLNLEETLAALDKTQNLNIQGGRVYDYLHAESSKSAKADLLLTRNLDHFQGLADQISHP